MAPWNSNSFLGWVISFLVITAPISIPLTIIAKVKERRENREHRESIARAAERYKNGS